MRGVGWRLNHGVIIAQMFEKQPRRTKDAHLSLEDLEGLRAVPRTTTSTVTQALATECGENMPDTFQRLSSARLEQPPGLILRLVSGMDEVAWRNPFIPGSFPYPKGKADLHAAINLTDTPLSHLPPDLAFMVLEAR
jgi:hypothetical protein